METFRREIFEQLGNLFYALAAEQHIPQIASGELKMLVRKDWLTETGYQSEDKVSEASHLIGLTIDSLQRDQTSADDAFGNFTRFYLKHREQFSAALKQKILETVESIVKMFPNGGANNVHFEELKAMLDRSKENSEIKT